MSSYEAIRQEIERRSRDVRDELASYISDDGRLALVKAPPGSGKTHLLLELAAHARRSLGLRVAIACQTNTCYRQHHSRIDGLSMYIPFDSLNNNISAYNKQR